MTDNGLAALAAAIKKACISPDPRSYNDTATAIAAAILGERGVFLADGMPVPLGNLTEEEIVAAFKSGYLVPRPPAEQAAEIATLRAALDDQYRETPPCPFCGHREHRDDICEQDLGEHGECQCADTRPRSDLAAASDLLCKYIDQTAEQAATIATLRDALDGLVEAAGAVLASNALDPDEFLALDRGILAALAHAKETGG